MCWCTQSPTACRTSSRCASGSTDRNCRSTPTAARRSRSEEHTSELQSLMRLSYAVFCLKKKKKGTQYNLHALNPMVTDQPALLIHPFDKSSVVDNAYD